MCEFVFVYGRKFCVVCPIHLSNLRYDNIIFLEGVSLYHLHLAFFLFFFHLHLSK